jgi:hypothetical protein
VSVVKKKISKTAQKKYFPIVAILKKKKRKEKKYASLFNFNLLLALFCIEMPER